MLHTNHCQHPMEDFIESHAGSDIFVYDSDGKQYYCIRHSSEDSDYTSLIRTLDEARDIAWQHKLNKVLDPSCQTWHQGTVFES